MPINEDLFKMCEEMTILPEVKDEDVQLLVNAIIEVSESSVNKSLNGQDLIKHLDEFDDKYHSALKNAVFINAIK